MVALPLRGHYGIDLEQQVRPGPIAGLAGKVRMRTRRVVCRGVGKINEERLFGLRLTLHEIDGFVGQVAVDQRTIVQPVRAQFFRFLTLTPFHDEGL